MAELTPEQIDLKKRIEQTESARLCALDLARIAVDGQYSGFADPRTAAIVRLEKMTQDTYRPGSIGVRALCGVENCTIVVDVDTALSDTFIAQGSCEKQRQIETGDHSCLSEYWDQRNSSSPEKRDEFRSFLDDECQSSTSTETIAWHCTAFDCAFSAGMTIDGNSGTSGECVKTQREALTDLPVCETPVDITKA